MVVAVRTRPLSPSSYATAHLVAGKTPAVAEGAPTASSSPLPSPPIPPPPPPPILGLRMRSRTSSSRNRGRVCTQPPTSPTSLAGESSFSVLLLVDRVNTMLKQDDTKYACADKYSQRCSTTSGVDGDKFPIVDCTVVDTVCREKMVEWMYRVADHFNEEREIVAMAVSALDRFVARCSCDRSAFKLAAMTTLQICSKTNGVGAGGSNFYQQVRPAVTMQSLADLSRGEFEISHLVEMEMIVLQTLGWSVNPPTVQGFIHAFYHFLPMLQRPGSHHPSSSCSSTSSTMMIASAIYQRAIFFAELVVYDHAFVTTERALLAVSALLNAMEGMDEASVPSHQQDIFLSILESVHKFKYPRDIIEDCRNRLWFVYSMSAQYRDEETLSSSCESSSASSSSWSATGSYNVDYKSNQQLPQTAGLLSSPVSVVVSSVQKQKL